MNLQYLCVYIGTGIYTFKVHGQIYHRLDQLRPEKEGPRHMQLYFYDTDETLSQRIKRSPHLDSKLIRATLRILENNPYVRVFRTVGQMKNLDDLKIELNTSFLLIREDIMHLLWTRLRLSGRMALMKKINLNGVLWFFQILGDHKLYGCTMVVMIR